MRWGYNSSVCAEIPENAFFMFSTVLICVLYSITSFLFLNTNKPTIIAVVTKQYSLDVYIITRAKSITGIPYTLLADTYVYRSQCRTWASLEQGHDLEAALWVTRAEEVHNIDATLSDLRLVLLEFITKLSEIIYRGCAQFQILPSELRVLCLSLSLYLSVSATRWTGCRAKKCQES